MVRSSSSLCSCLFSPFCTFSFVTFILSSFLSTLSSHSFFPTSNCMEEHASTTIRRRAGNNVRVYWIFRTSPFLVLVTLLSILGHTYSHTRELRAFLRGTFFPLVCSFFFIFRLSTSLPQTLEEIRSWRLEIVNRARCLPISCPVWDSTRPTLAEGATITETNNIRSRKNVRTSESKLLLSYKL